MWRLDVTPVCTTSLCYITRVTRLETGSNCLISGTPATTGQDLSEAAVITFDVIAHETITIDGVADR
ncbi:MAG: hypothetical protein A07HR60_02295 [uncultured archaeon A07HR60]|nr:MAG: hypothetical protein A07HR60_02295 [uncultured archaeon A07HR60]